MFVYLYCRNVSVSQVICYICSFEVDKRALRRLFIVGCNALYVLFVANSSLLWRVMRGHTSARCTGGHVPALMLDLGSLAATVFSSI